ncbi:hypothetical protein A5712_10075 [Mycobacterium sp. E2327]|uniref:hypothetical protein n=1 Tax=Mycobacterium sp. E2327 TaxID=1834132 RepID=UPI0007FBB3E5|nr:hypothetical protein [Mycobacterium sp. E2327]OBI11148.1 hypothetical protein A5712_10075 [Mycobacterium sp. E2327]
MPRQVKPPGGYDADAVLAWERTKQRTPWWLYPCGCDRRNNRWYRLGIPHPSWTPYWLAAIERGEVTEADLAAYRELVAYERQRDD